MGAPGDVPCRVPASKRTVVGPTRTGRAGIVAALTLVLVSSSRPALAHGVGGLSTLPAPLSFFLAGVATLLVVLFAGLAVWWPLPRWQEKPAVKAIRVPGWRLVVMVLRTLAVGSVIVVVVAGLIGPPNSVRNPAPALVWVGFWLALPLMGALLGDIYHLLNPWRSLARIFRVGPSNPPGAIRGGIWAATVAFLGFVWFEVVYPQPAHPRHLAVVAVGYTVALLGACEWLGRPAFDQIDPFTTYNRLISAMAPFQLEPDRGPGWRGWLRGLLEVDEPPGLAAFAVAMVGSVVFHGLSGFAWYETSFGGFGRSIFGGTLLLALAVSLVGAGYWMACRWMASQALGETTARVARRFAPALVPIAFAFMMAHYSTVLLFEGQLLLSTLSDPFGLGWDLFGTAGRPVNFDFVSPFVIWWGQVFAIVAGHLVAMVLVHERSLQDFDGLSAARGRRGFLLVFVVLAGAGLTIVSYG